MRFWRFWLNVVIMLLVAGYGPDLAAQEVETQKSPRFRPEAEAAGEYITLVNLAEMSPEMAQRYGQALVWSAPPPGQIYTLTREFLQFRLTQLGLWGMMESAELPPAIQVRQVGVLLSGEEVAAAFRRYIQGHTHWPATDLKMQVYPLEEPLLLPDHHVTLEMLPPRQGKLLGEVTMEMVILRQGQPYKRQKVTGMVRLERHVLCAARSINPSEILESKDVQLTRRDITEMTGQDFFTSPDQVIGRTLGRRLGPQEIITHNHLSNQPIIKRGDEVTVIMEQDGLAISTKGVAKEEGFPGRDIRMVNPKSNREFQARVVDGKTVQVSL